jgi:catechol 2,3-dioxygenase-like lactoylglutathione lyase family enzyme
VIPTGRLNHIHLNVADVQRSLLFYQRVFGATEAFRVGDKMVFLQLPGTEDVITLHEVGGPVAVEHLVSCVMRVSISTARSPRSKRQAAG